MNIAIAGTGYVGLVTVYVLRALATMSAVSISTQKSRCSKAVVTHLENDLEDLMRRHKENISYTTDAEIAYKNADIIFIGVGTPKRRQLRQSPPCSPWRTTFNML